MNDITDLTPQFYGIDFVNVFTVKQDLTAAGFQHPVDHPHGRCLPGTGCPDKTYKFTLIDFKVDMFDRDIPASIDFFNVLEQDHWLFFWHLTRPPLFGCFYDNT